jgi:HK97 family phage portal protein
MGVMRRAWNKVAGWALRGVSIGSEAAAGLFGYRPTLSGTVVSDVTALESPAYFAGVRNVSEDLATLPLITYRRIDERKRERDPDFYLYPILHDMPNEEIDAVTFFEMQQAWLMMRRNAYAEIVRDRSGRCMGLWPIPPSRVSVRRFEGEMLYQVSLPPGMTDPQSGLPFKILDRSRILHVKALALDGILGLNSITTHSEAIGLSLALDRYGAAFFGNDGTPGGTYEHPGKLTDPAYKRLKGALEDRHKGLENAHRIAILEEGMKFNATSVPNDKAQFIDSKRYSVEDMGRLNRIAPHKIGDLSRATFSNIEHQGIDYVVSTIRPPAVRWERAIHAQVYLSDDRKTHYSEFLLDALLRGDSQQRAAAFATMRQNGVINADEWRAMENMNPIEDGTGELYLVNGTMTQVGGQDVPIDRKVEGVGALIRAGYTPEAACSALGLPPLAHLGFPPITLQNPKELKQQPKDVAPVDEPDAARLFRPLFLAAAQRCVHKEATALAKAVEKVLRPNGMRAFEGWVTEFYRDHGATIKQAFVPIAVAVGEAIRGTSGPDLGEWAEDYAQNATAARAKAAGEAIRSVVGSCSAPDLANGLLAMLDRWKGTEAERMATAEAEAMVVSARKYLARGERAA